MSPRFAQGWTQTGSKAISGLPQIVSFWRQIRQASWITFLLMQTWPIVVFKSKFRSAIAETFLENIRMSQTQPPWALSDTGIRCFPGVYRITRFLTIREKWSYNCLAVCWIDAVESRMSTSGWMVWMELRVSLVANDVGIYFNGIIDGICVSVSLVVCFLSFLLFCFILFWNCWNWRDKERQQQRSPGNLY